MIGSHCCVAWRMVRNPLDLIYDNPYTHTSIHTNRVIKYLPWQVFYLSLSLPLKLKILQFNLINKKNYTKKNLRILVCFTWLKFVWDGKFTLFYLLNTVSGKKYCIFFSSFFFSLCISLERETWLGDSPSKRERCLSVRATCRVCPSIISIPVSTNSSFYFFSRCATHYKKLIF